MTMLTHCLESSSNDMRVIPGRIKPLSSGGVINSFSVYEKKKIEKKKLKQ